VLNTIVAESLDFIATKLEADVKGGKDLNKAIQELLPAIVKESKKVVFNGNNYSEDWHKEAEKRGLPNLKSTTDVLPVVIRKDTLEVFTKYKVYTEKELHSRFNILSENYVKQVTIEAKTALLMARTIILPAALKYQKLVGESVAAAKAAGAGTPAGIETLSAVVSGINDLGLAITSLEKAESHHSDGDAYSHARHIKDHVIPTMLAVRQAADHLETIVDDDLWPLPTYREMLFIK
jgi:glutamine synthetase